MHGMIVFNDVERSNGISGRIQKWETRHQEREVMIGDIFWVRRLVKSASAREVRIWHRHFAPIPHPHIYSIGAVTPSIEYLAGVRSSESIEVLTPPSSNIGIMAIGSLGGAR
jgi:hypothetical protein